MLLIKGVCSQSLVGELRPHIPSCSPPAQKRKGRIASACLPHDRHLIKVWEHYPCHHCHIKAHSPTPLNPRNLTVQGVCYSLSHVQLFVTPQTVAHQASLSVEFSKPEYWSGLPFPSPEDFLDLGIEPWSPTLQADSLSFELQGSPTEEYARWAFPFCQWNTEDNLIHRQLSNEKGIN